MVANGFDSAPPHNCQTVHAHDNLSVKEAKLFVSETEAGKMVGSIQNNIDPAEKFSKIDQIIEMIERTLPKMYDEIINLQEELPDKS